MAAAQVFSGTGDPNGVVFANPGDIYQDQTGQLWVNTAAPSTWSQFSVLPDVTDTVGSNVDCQVRLNVTNPLNVGGIRFNVSTPNGSHSISSQSFPGRSFYSGPEVDAEFFGARSGPQDLGIGAGGNFNNMLVVRSQCFGVPPGGGSTITGIDANTSGSNPPMDPFPWITIFNDGLGSLTIAHESGLSAADNRFRLVGAVNLVIPPNGGVVIARRSAPTNRWFVVGVNN